MNNKKKLIFIVLMNVIIVIIIGFYLYLKYQKNILTDDTTGTNYTLGVDNGLLYILSLD